MDTTQLLLTLVLTISAFFFVIIGIQLIFVLKELRKALKNVNTVIEGFEEVGVGLEHGLAEIIGFLNGFKSLIKIFDIFATKKNEKDKQSSLI